MVEPERLVMGVGVEGFLDQSKFWGLVSEFEVML